MESHQVCVGSLRLHLAGLLAVKYRGRAERHRSRVVASGPRGYNTPRLFVGTSWYADRAPEIHWGRDPDGASMLLYSQGSESMANYFTEGSSLLVCISYFLLSGLGVYLERLVEINGI